MAITDIMYQCERRDNNSSDTNLIGIVYNTVAITEVLENYPVETIFFSSRFVEKEFKKHFADLIEAFSKLIFVTLPSPSPRYASMSKKEKVERCRVLLPKL
jgi:hypothetical protein